MGSFPGNTLTVLVLILTNALCNDINSSRVHTCSPYNLLSPKGRQTLHFDLRTKDIHWGQHQLALDLDLNITKKNVLDCKYLINYHKLLIPLCHSVSHKLSLYLLSQ